ncbi:MAG: hypothetical protein RLZZ398_616 [Verrucomicrobiota bacterium]|jgi:pimeloyl-ACP methyl ester carboxylesterase
MVKLPHPILIVATFLLAACTQLATAKEINLAPVGLQVVPSKDRLVSLDDHIRLAEAASHKLERNPGDDQARREYNFAVARICGSLRQSKLTPWAAPVKLASHTLTWKRDPHPEMDPAKYEFIPADQLEIHGKSMAVREIKSGLGAPLVAKRVADQTHELAPTPHFYFTVTAIARFTGSRCEIEIVEALEHETVSVGGHTWPLAADFTAPLAMTLTEMETQKLNIPRLLRPAEFAGSTRISRLEPYDPNKTVVLLVHGLASSPTTWFPLLNQLRNDPAIRDNYQFWFYSYPSGYPYSYSASILRKELDQVEKHYPLHQKMVVIGHSMGGCISRLLITDSKQQIWNQMFTVTPEQMDMTPDHKHILTESSIFEHRPEIGRVIFISTPHRGSDLATNWIGKAFIHLVKIPDTLLSIGIEEARYKKHRAGEKHLDRFPDSIDTLAPNNDFVTAINTVPIKAGIPYHTIAGDRGHGDAPKSSDGVVPYWSSHQSGALSEKIVPTNHGAHQHQEAMDEVTRILHEHQQPHR